MANKCMKIRLIPLVIRQMLIETTIQCYCTPIKMVKHLKRLTMPSVGKDVEQLELSHCDNGNVKWDVPVTTWETVGQFL